MTLGRPKKIETRQTISCRVSRGTFNYVTLNNKGGVGQAIDALVEAARNYEGTPYDESNLNSIIDRLNDILIELRRFQG